MQPVMNGRRIASVVRVSDQPAERARGRRGEVEPRGPRPCQSAFLVRTACARSAAINQEAAVRRVVELHLRRIAGGVKKAVGVLSLLLAAVGLYGVIAYSVSLGTREVGIRMALGAERSQVLRMVLGQGARLALIGIGLGVVLAGAAARVLQSMLYGVSAFDPVAYGAAAGLLLLVALAANLVPAVTAARVAPATAIRG